ncbi:hypothetical protein [Flavobacterium sp. ZS1P14]|uniref:hypothetical protein n=1 Tax=Flavobacterium sp. ZS1P14 TaxID=3401729 RepID=UPI003AAA62CB
MTIEELKARFGMTIHELIEMIKLGNVFPSEFGILSLPNGKYAERAMILFEDKYFVTYTVLDNHLDIFYHEDIDVFDRESQASVFYQNLETNLDGEVYE